MSIIFYAVGVGESAMILFLIICIIYFEIKAYRKKMT